MLRVISYPRLHVALFDLANATPRRYGGAGFSLSGLPAVVEASPSSSMGIDYLTTVDRSTRIAVSTAISKMQRARPDASARLKILKIPPQHVGLGSKTATVLAALKALDLATNSELTNNEIQSLSGRGGTSGIGINTFFVGGFLIDGGHDSHHSPGFSPSRYRRGFEIPPLIYHDAIPSNWRFHLLMGAGKQIFGNDESDFFRKNTPVSEAEVFQTIAVAYHGLIPAVASGDIRILREVLQSLHTMGFKRRELNNQGAKVRELLHALGKRHDCAAGLSSMGPLVYAVSEADNHDLDSFIEACCQRGQAQVLGTFTGRNRGYRSL